MTNIDPQEWAEGIWSSAVPAWNARVQDRTYREFVARPAIERAIAAIPPSEDGVVVDFGCGDGLETTLLKGILEHHGWTGALYAYDPQPHLIAHAQRENAREGIIYTAGSYDELFTSLPRRADLLVSQFVLQDAPHVDGLIENIENMTREGGSAIVTLVHPEFGEAMRAKGACRVNEELAGPWRWAAEYPIVEPDGRTFMVPYFQRSVEDYRTIFSRHFGGVEISGSRPEENAVAQCQRERRSPFCDHPGNVYYPEIIQQDSCLLIEARK